MKERYAIQYDATKWLAFATKRLKQGHTYSSEYIEKLHQEATALGQGVEIIRQLRVISNG